VTLNIARPCCHQDLTQYRHKVVRDLVWSLFSRDLIDCTQAQYHCLDDDWLCRLLVEILPALAALDEDPAPLIDDLAAARSNRLGESFERLVAHGLLLHPDLELVARNQPVRGNGGTVGEIDLLLRHRGEDRLLAIETSVKFYLGPRNGDRDPARWIGPDGRDCLSTRLQRLERQLRLCQHPATRAWLRAHGLPECRIHALVRGRLFHHRSHWQRAAAPAGLAKDHLRGWWVAQSELGEWLERGVQWLVLDRSDWLAPLCCNDLVQPLDTSSLQRLVDSRLFRQPVCLAEIVEGQERSRGFVLPQTMENKLFDNQYDTKQSGEQS